MKENIVQRMHLVLGAGLDLLERLDRGETPRFETEHSNIQALIVAGGELDYDPTYRGEIANMMGRNTLSGDAGSFFLGVQYALACWLDEMFIMQSPQWWRDKWSEASIEVALVWRHPTTSMAVLGSGPTCGRAEGIARIAGELSLVRDARLQRRADRCTTSDQPTDLGR